MDFTSRRARAEALHRTCPIHGKPLKHIGGGPDWHNVWECTQEGRLPGHGCFFGSDEVDGPLVDFSMSRTLPPGEGYLTREQWRGVADHDR